MQTVSPHRRFFIVITCTYYNIFLLLSIQLQSIITTEAFSLNNNNHDGGSSSMLSSSPINTPAFTLVDRFWTSCPADPDSIRRFDPNLLLVDNDDDGDDDNNSETTWAAVFRCDDAVPSVLIRDDFFGAMRMSTTSRGGSSSTTTTNNNENNNNNNENNAIAKKENRLPVAIARISPSPLYPGSFVIDTVRCNLEKEKTNDVCDGGSEYCESIGMCIDELLLHHLEQCTSVVEALEEDDDIDGDGDENDDSIDCRRRFFEDGSIRTKATLFSSKLFENRGFEEVSKIYPDMASHVSSLSGSFLKYSNRVLDIQTTYPGGHGTARRILLRLGQISPDGGEDIDGNNAGTANTDGDDDSDDTNDGYDPWASVKKYI